MRHVSRRFKEVSEMPLLWREFVWLDYEPRHVCSVSNALEVSGEHVRRMFIPTDPRDANKDTRDGALLHESDAFEFT